MIIDGVRYAPMLSSDMLGDVSVLSGGESAPDVPVVLHDISTIALDTWQIAYTIPAIRGVSGLILERVSLVLKTLLNFHEQTIRVDDNLVIELSFGYDRFDSQAFRLVGYNLVFGDDCHPLVSHAVIEYFDRHYNPEDDANAYRNLYTLLSGHELLDEVESPIDGLIDKMESFSEIERRFSDYMDNPAIPFIMEYLDAVFPEMPLHDKDHVIKHMFNLYGKK